MSGTSERELAAGFVLLAWWLSTAIVLGLVWLRRSTFRWIVAAATILALTGLAGLAWSSRVSSASSAYSAFVCALVVWAWHELTFLLGIITGPRKSPCPPDAEGWKRFAYATAAVIHHEVGLALSVLVVLALTWEAPNQVGAYTFLVLWIMRLSAKINVFLGVRNLTEEFVPDHLRYMSSYFRRARMNPLMPISIVSGGAVALYLVYGSCSQQATDFVVVGKTLVATILGLAVLEHIFLTVPVREGRLWRWAIRDRSPLEARVGVP